MAGPDVACAPYACSAGVCAVDCQASAECVSIAYCANHVCLLKQDGGSGCVSSGTNTADEACFSDLCLGARCCAGACSTGDPICGAHACGSSGACVYPNDLISCGPVESCTAGIHTPPSACDADGGCLLVAPVPCGAYTCDSAGLACYKSCTVGDDTHCAGGNYCSPRGCAPQIAAGGPCSHDDACLSGTCRGACCSGVCDPDVATSCVGTCDATGVCQHATCALGYGCAGTATCKTTCTSTADCAPGSGYTCTSPLGGSCCLPVASGGTVYVDGKLGSDTNCCDSAASACLTLTHAMSLISAAGATGVTLNATWNADPTTRSDWAPVTGETYPIHLGLGVTLKAPAIFFTPPPPTFGGQPIDAFEVFAYDAADNSQVTIEGDPAVDFVFIGFDSSQTNLTGTDFAVNDGVGNQTAVPLNLTMAWMNGQRAALFAGAGADVTLGPDPVIIGSGNGQLSVTSPGRGILCQGSVASVASITDIGSSPVLRIDGQAAGDFLAAISDIDAEDQCNLTLTQSPVLGRVAGPMGCGVKTDGVGVMAAGSAQVIFKNGTIQCMNQQGLFLQNAATGSVTLDNDLIEYTGCSAVSVLGGTLGPVTNTTFFHNRFGVHYNPGSTGTIDLSGGIAGVSSGNILACTTVNEPSSAHCNGVTPPAPDVWNETSFTIDASNVAWDTGPTPQLWTCDPTQTDQYSACTCSGSTSCPDAGGPQELPDDADAVVFSGTIDGLIDQSNPTQQITYPGCN